MRPPARLRCRRSASRSRSRELGLIADDPRLALSPAPGRFTEAETEGLPEAVQRYFAAAIAEGAPIARSARLKMRGRIKIGRWVPFAAAELLTPERGFVWAARAAGVIVGSDRFVDGTGGMSWKLAGLIPVMHSEGPDVSRSAAGRVAGEALWLPTAVLPRFGVKWKVDGSNRISCRRTISGEDLTVRYSLGDDGRVLSTCFDRWGDPEGGGSWGTYAFGGEMTAWQTFDGITIPSAGRLGWFYGSDRWEDSGEFFRFEITSLRLID